MDPECLLENADWAHRLARKLVGDDRADDLVQDAWVTAIESRACRPGSIRAWLYRVLLNRARRFARTDRRRIQRERRVARDEATPSTEAVVERLQAHRSLAEHVEALREPYRSTLILRYYEDLRPREIAMREGVAVTTVRSRIDRGIRQLREALDRSHAGDRSRWLAGLAPLFLDKPTTCGTVAKGTAAAGLVTVALTLMLLPDPNTNTDRGIVVDDRGKPVEGALVRAFRPQRTFNGFDGPAVRTDARGHFHFDDRDDDVSFRVRITAPGRRAAAGWASAGRRGRITLLAAHEVGVRVVEAATQRPLSGARVWCSQLERGRGGYDPPLDEATSDARGRASVMLCVGRAKVFASRPGFAPAMVELDVGRGGTDLRIALAPGGQLRGVVVDRHDRPLAGVRVDGRANVQNIGPFRQSTVTDRSGAFVLTDVPTSQAPGGRIVLRFAHDAHAQTVRYCELPTPRSATIMKVTLERACTFVGTVRWRDGSPAPRLDVRVLPLARVSPHSMLHGVPTHANPMNRLLWERAETDPNGWVSIDGLADGDVVVEVSRDYKLLSRTTERVGGGVRPAVIRLDEDPPERAALTLRVQTATGEPIAGARVTLVEGAMRRTATTDSRGQAMLADLPRRPLTGFVTPTGRLPREFRVTSTDWDAGTVVVQVSRGGVVGGRVVRPDGSPAVVAVRLVKTHDCRPDPTQAIGAHTLLGPSLVFGGDDSGGRVISDSEGRFEFRDVGDGNYKLTVDQAFDVVDRPDVVRSGMTDIRVTVRTPGDRR